MRVLLDECVPKRLGRHLVGHTVSTVTHEGWSSQKNGVLLGSMSAAGFEVLVTVDQGLRYQQNVRAFGIAVIVLHSVSNQIEDLLPLVPGILAVLATIRSGDVADVG